MAGGVEILALVVVRGWPAVTDIATAVRDSEHEMPHFSAECIVLPIASPVQPPHQSCRAGRRKRVQHRQNGGRTYARAEQHDRALAGLQDEASARCNDVERLAQQSTPQPVSPSRS